MKGEIRARAAYNMDEMNGTAAFDIITRLNALFGSADFRVSADDGSPYAFIYRDENDGFCRPPRSWSSVEVFLFGNESEKSVFKMIKDNSDIRRMKKEFGYPEREFDHFPLSGISQFAKGFLDLAPLDGCKSPDELDLKTRILGI